MKHLTMFAVLIALTAGTALAQQDMGNTSVTGATYTTGIVVSLDSSQLTLRDESDQVMTILLVSGTVGAEDHPIGSRVRVNFHNNESGQMVADVIQGAPGETEVAEVEVRQEKLATTPAPTEPATTYEPEPTPAPAPTTARAPIYAEEPDEDETATLPSTAGSLFAIGLLGLLSLGGALVIRQIR